MLEGEGGGVLNHGIWNTCWNKRGGGFGMDFNKYLFIHTYDTYIHTYIRISNFCASSISVIRLSDESVISCSIAVILLSDKSVIKSSIAIIYDYYLYQ
jgi:hypothetical protein